MRRIVEKPFYNNIVQQGLDRVCQVKAQKGFKIWSGVIAENASAEFT